MAYKIMNGAMPTTGMFPAVTTGTAIKTMLQVATPTTRQLQVVSWGYTLNGPPNGAIELIQTDVAATVTAHVASGVQPLDPNAPPSLVTLGAAATGYTATVEGAITATRLFDEGILTTVNQGMFKYDYQFLPNEAPIIPISKFLRVRCLMGSAVNMICYVVVTELG